MYCIIIHNIIHALLDYNIALGTNFSKWHECNQINVQCPTRAQLHSTRVVKCFRCLCQVVLSADSTCSKFIVQNDRCFFPLISYMQLQLSHSLCWRTS